MRLIDADAFYEQHGNYYAEQGPEDGFIGTVGDLISRQPTIEPEVRHGRWIERKAEFGVGILYECSVCHQMCEHYTHIHYKPSPYCMHCGARMDGGANDNAPDQTT